MTNSEHQVDEKLLREDEREIAEVVAEYIPGTRGMADNCALLLSRLTEERRRVAELVTVLHKLTCEAKSFKSLVRISDVGVTNLRCLNIKIDAAEEALAEARKGGNDGGTQA